LCQDPVGLVNDKVTGQGVAVNFRSRCSRSVNRWVSLL
jgi:Tfp pilus assembly protein PilN